MTGSTDTLVILTPAFPASEAETVWVRPKQLFIRKLQEHFPSLHIIILAFNYPLHNEEYSWRGIKVVSFNGLNTRRLKRVWLWVRVWKKLKELRRVHPRMGILSFWCGECALVGRHFAGRYNLRHVAWISGMDAKKENKLMRLIRPSERELVAMSVFLEKEFFRNHKIKPAHTIPIGIDCDEFNLPGGERDIDILGVGTLNPFKQYDLFIEIVKEISGTYPGIKAVICGEGTDRERLEQLIATHGLTRNITLTGLITHEKVLLMMQRAKVFLHPSAYEGFGAVCLEALYAGAAVISFCDPMELRVDRWHIVRNKAEMTHRAFEHLQSNEQDRPQVLLYSMENSVKEMMKLFELKSSSYHAI